MLVIVFAAALVAAVTPAAADSGSATLVEDPLTWAPPEGWESFEEFVIPAEGGSFRLDPTVDYRISAPEVITGEVALKGGRNVVWIGGEWDISGFPTPAGSATDRRALVIVDRSGNLESRVIHLEGLLMSGDDLAEGIDVAAPTAILQIQNVHVAGVYLRGADDRDHTGPYDVAGWSGNHADVLQPWGGYQEIRIDGLTGRTTYQGFYYVDSENGTGNTTRTYLRRMNLEAISRVGPDDGYTYTGHKLFRWSTSETGQMFLDNGTVWAKHHPDSSWANGYIYKHAYRDRPEDYPGYDVILPDPSPGTAVFRDAFYPYPTITTDSLGQYAWWNQTLDNGLPAVRNWDDTGPGRFYSGTPPSGDYVPASTVGRTYQSPGYHRPPVAVADVATVAEGGTVAISVLANDSDPDGDPLAATVVSAPAAGTTQPRSDGAIMYSHDGSETGADRFTYIADDGQLTSEPVAVSVTITPINDPPVANDDTVTVEAGNTVSGTVAANDTDAEGDALRYVVHTGPAHGRLELDPDGSFAYTHDGGTSSIDTFTYFVSDGMANSSPASVDITIVQANGSEGPTPSLPVPQPPPHTADALDGVGLVDTANAIWHLQVGTGATSFYYGNPGDMPFVGDWDCDGVETPGLYRRSDGYAYLRNANSAGIADLRFFVGDPADIPLAGDFDGDGCDSLTLYRPSEARVYVFNELRKDRQGIGAADYSFMFGNPGDHPVVGDWDGDGREEVGLFRESVGYLYYRHELDSGPADHEFYIGDPGDRLVAGDWSGDGIDTPAIYRPSAEAFLFRFTNTPGFADATWAWGDESWTPVAGDLGK